MLALGGGDDVAAVSANVTVPVRFDGGAGNDGLFGGGGTDVFLGGAGNDNVVSRDGSGEKVDCGAGLDTAISDDADTRTSCEEIEGDADGDGVRRPADCDDTNPGIRPGATDVPDDRIDQDCSGADATNLDVDGDGTPRPQDCDDAQPRDPPGRARDRRQRGRRELRHPRGRVPRARRRGPQRLGALGRRTVNRTLTARDFPRGTRIELRCRGAGCPFRRVVRRVTSGRPVKLHALRQPRARPRRARRGPAHALGADRPRAALPDRRARHAERRVPLPAARRPGPRLLSQPDPPDRRVRFRGEPL